MEAIAVDWSGNARSGRGIFLARARAGELLGLEAGISREAVIDRVIELTLSSPDPVAVGLDFAFSMPAWYPRQLGLRSAEELWAVVEHDGETWLRNCLPPFWGRPGTTRPKVEAHFRTTEEQVQPVAGIRPKSVFQIGGAGAVGTGSLRGMPALLRLASAGFSIWPFDEPRFPVVVEIWPRSLTGPVNKSDAAARGAYLRALSIGEIPEVLRELAESSEDAFDAAVSAVEMSLRADELSGLRRAVDATALLEGKIWAPGLGLARPPAPGGSARATLPSNP